MKPCRDYLSQVECMLSFLMVPIMKIHQEEKKKNDIKGMAYHSRKAIPFAETFL